MTGNLCLIDSRKTPPDKPSTSAYGMGLFKRMGRTSAIALLVLLQQILFLGVHAACTDNSITAPTDPSSYTYVIGSGAYTWTVPAWT